MLISRGYLLQQFFTGEQGHNRINRGTRLIQRLVIT
jgi:hypothetical protein